MNNWLSNKIVNDTRKGTESELLFCKLMGNNNYKSFLSTKNQNMIEHWDVVCVKDNKYERFDVKSLKEGTNLGYAWIELVNVIGRTGWIRSEYMDTIAFENVDCFEFVKRIDLLELVENGIKKADEEDGEAITFCSKINLKYYRRYSRVGRKDLIVKVPIEDFKKLIYKRIYK